MRKLIGVLLLCLLLLAGGGIAYLYLRKPAAVPPAPVVVEVTPARVARGKYVFLLADCDGCHSERDPSRFGAPVVASGRGKGTVLPASLGLPGTVVAPNITPDLETGIGNWSDGEKIRAIRDGVDRDGKALFPLMPYPSYRHMSDNDVYSLVAFLKTLAPVKNALPATKIDFPVSLLIKSVPQPAGRVPDPNPGDKLKYGEYLATVGDCADCHTPMKSGKADDAMLLAGGRLFRWNSLTVVSANITPDEETGIGAWTEQLFVNRLTAYKEMAKDPPKVGPESFTLMPWLNLSQIEPQDLSAIYAYLRTQRPIHNHVEIHPAATRKEGT
jgi:mono/diheme cytochrome c family protein